MRKVELLREVFTSTGRQGPGDVEISQDDFDAIQRAEKATKKELMRVKRKAKAPVAEGDS